MVPPYLLKHVDLLREVGQHPTWEGEPLRCLASIFIFHFQMQLQIKKRQCVAVRPRGQSGDPLNWEDGHEAARTLCRRARAVPELSRCRLHRCQPGRRVRLRRDGARRAGAAEHPPPGDGRASPRLAGGRTVSSQRCPPPHSSGAVADSRPVEQRFPGRSRAPVWDKSRGNLLRSQAAPETLSYGPKVVIFPNLFFPLILLKNIVCIMLQIVGCVLFFFF